MSLNKCLKDAGFSRDQIRELTNRNEGMVQEGETLMDSFKNRLMPQLEQELFTDLNSIREQLGVKTLEAPVRDTPVAPETAPVQEGSASQVDTGDLVTPEQKVAEKAQTSGQQQAAVERQMSDEAGKLSDALNKAVEKVTGKLTGTKADRAFKGIDNNTFINAVDKIAGENPKARAKALAEAVKGSTRLPKNVKTEIEAALGEPIKDFVKRVKDLQTQREGLGKKAAQERKTKAQAQRDKTAGTDYTRDAKIDDAELASDGMIALKTEDINEIREYVDLDRYDPGKKSMGQVIQDARQYMSTGRENFVREASVVNEILNGNPAYDIEAKMIALRRGIDHLEKSIEGMMEARDNAKNARDRKDMTARIEMAREDMHHFTLAYNKIGTLGGRILAFRKEHIQSDFYSPKHLRELMQEAKGGEKLTKREEAYVRRKSKELKGLREEIDNLNREVNVRSESAMAAVAKNEIKKMKQKSRKRGGRRKSKYTVADAAAKLRKTLENGPC